MVVQMSTPSRPSLWAALTRIRKQPHASRSSIEPVGRGDHERVEIHLDAAAREQPFRPRDARAEAAADAGRREEAGCGLERRVGEEARRNGSTPSRTARCAASVGPARSFCHGAPTRARSKSASPLAPSVRRRARPRPTRRRRCRPRARATGHAARVAASSTRPPPCASISKPSPRAQRASALSPRPTRCPPPRRGREGVLRDDGEAPRGDVGELTGRASREGRDRHDRLDAVAHGVGAFARLERARERERRLDAREGRGRRARSVASAAASVAPRTGALNPTIDARPAKSAPATRARARPIRSRSRAGRCRRSSRPTFRRDRARRRPRRSRTDLRRRP